MCGQMMIHLDTCPRMPTHPAGNAAVLRDQRGPVRKCYHLRIFSECPECRDTMDTPGQQVIEERAKIRGDFREQARVSQMLKGAVRSQKGWEKLSEPQQECLEHMLEKIARIITGDPNEVDAWRDLMGYPQLIFNILTKGKPV